MPFPLKNQEPRDGDYEQLVKQLEQRQTHGLKSGTSTNTGVGTGSGAGTRGGAGAQAAGDRPGQSQDASRKAKPKRRGKDRMMPIPPTGFTGSPFGFISEGHGMVMTFILGAIWLILLAITKGGALVSILLDLFF